MIRAIALLFCLLAAVPASGEYPYDSVCRVVVNGRVGGSGVLIGVSKDQALVLTVRHVALRPGLLAECDWSGIEKMGRVLAVSDRADIALLVVARPAGLRPVPIALPSRETGPVVFVGFPGYDRATMRYQVGDFVQVDDTQLVVTCRPEKGMSGGAAFDRYGRVVGTVSAFGRKYGYAGSGVAMIEIVKPHIQ